MPSNLGLYRDWRHMFIVRPRLQFHGCYISKMTYVRPGENSFQDTSYQVHYLFSRLLEIKIYLLNYLLPSHGIWLTISGMFIIKV